MKALVYGGPGKKEWKEVPNPTIQKPTDVIVKVETTTICGTDLHILQGDVPAVTPVIMPLVEPIAATAGLLLIQAPPGTALLHSTLAPVHTGLAPNMAVGVGLTDMVVVIAQPVGSV